MKKKEYELLIRLFIETSDEDEGKAITNTIISKINDYVSITQCRIQPYWKIPENLEIFITMLPKIEPMMSFQGVLHALGSGWKIRDSKVRSDCYDEWAILVPRDMSGTFFSKLICWGNVKLFPKQ